MKSDPIIIIFGATGGLGQYIIRECKKRELEYLAIPRHITLYHQYEQWFHLDKDGVKQFGNDGACGPPQKNFEECMALLERARRNGVAINCIGFGDVPGCDDDPVRSFESNVNSIVNVVKFVKDFDMHIVHVSTNDVFGQETPPGDGWRTNFFPVAFGTYATHKHLGEQALQSIYPDDKFAIVRATFMSPWSKSKGGETFYYTTWKTFRDAQLYPPSGEQCETVWGYTNQGTCPLSVDTYASALVDMALRKQTGVVHLSSSEEASRYDVLRHIQDVVNNNASCLLGKKYEGDGTKHAWLHPVTHDLEEECKKFVKLCEDFEKHGKV